MLFPKASVYEKKQFVIHKNGENIQIDVKESYSRLVISPKMKSLAESFGIHCNDRESFANSRLSIEVAIDGFYHTQIFKDQRNVSLEEQIDLILQYFLDAPDIVKAHRIERARKEEEQRIRSEIQNFNEEIIKSQVAQFEKAREEFKLYKELMELKDYLSLIKIEMRNLTDPEKELAGLWIKIVSHYAEQEDPLQKRIQKFKKIANQKIDAYTNFWCKQSKEYSPCE